MNKFLNKIKFGLNLDPKIEKVKDRKRYIPEGSKAVLIIYADFELGWAWRYSKSNDRGKEYADNLGLEERKNVPAILEVFDEFGIPVTWATVGHLFLHSCGKSAGIPHAEIKRLDYFDNSFWRYSEGDWFDADPCTDYVKNPGWYCPDLIEKIRRSGTGHEIGCHTFSHIDCTDKVCPPEVFDTEIRECKTLAEKEGINLKSFVHPAHTIGNLDGLIKHGFSSYRTDYDNILGYPEKYKDKLWQIKSTWEFVLFREWSRKYHIYRYIEILKRAIKNETVCVLWFHPSMNLGFFETVFPEVCNFINDRRKDIHVTTAGDYTDFLDRNSIQQ